MRRFAVAAALVLTVAATAFAEEDAEGLKDHPEVPRFPGSFILMGQVNDFDAHEFQVGGGKTESREGRSWFLHYRFEEGARQPSPIELFRNYENAFKKKGGQLVAKETGGDEPQATLKMPLGKSERWMEVGVTNSGIDYTLRIIDVGAMEQKIELSAGEMADELKKNGKVVLRGINFASGKADIQSESMPLLDEIVKLMGLDASLKLSIEGHTDDVGDRKANLALSKKRAEAVVKHLAGKGVDRKRLASNGFGAQKPVADNRTEEGRAQNRRVELVRLK